MEILNISKKEREVVVTLNSDELVKLCNTMYNAKESDKNNLFYKLYSELMIARDLSQYGHIDDFCLERIIENRGKIVKKSNEKWGRINEHI